MSESATTDGTFPDNEDLTEHDYEGLSLDAKVAWLRYAAVTVIKRDGVRERQMNRLRRQLVAVSACAVVISLVAIGVVAYLTVTTASRTDIRNEQYDYIRGQLRMLVCAIPPGDEARDALRAQARCGRYTPTPAVSGGRPSSGTTTRRSADAERATAGLSQSAQGSAATTSRGSRPRNVETTVQPQTSASTPRAPRGSKPTPARTVTAAPQPTPTGTQGLLPGVLCTVIGCKPRTETQ